VTIHALPVHDLTRGEAVLDVRLSVTCSTGTYVRAIARDLGAALGTGGHLTSLRRTAVGPVDVTEAAPLAALEEAGEVRVHPLDEVVGRFFPTVTVDEDGARAVGHGGFLTVELGADGPVAVLGPDGRFLALYRRTDDERGSARPVAVFT
jgi:tRNA pseudouridine55 synthase